MIRKFIWLLLLLPVLGCGQVSDTEGGSMPDTTEIFNVLDSSGLHSDGVVIDLRKSSNAFIIGYYNDHLFAVKCQLCGVDADSLDQNHLDSLLTTVKPADICLIIEFPDQRPKEETTKHFDSFLKHIESLGFHKYFID